MVVLSSVVLGQKTKMNLAAILALIIASVAESHGLDACQIQCGSPINSTRTAEYCEQHNLTLWDRCCYNHTSNNETTESVVGIDLHNCSLENTTGLFENMSSLVIISLEENFMLKEVRAKDFYHLTSLQYLSLPGEVNSTICPGGKDAWQSSTYMNDTLLCMNQINTCLNIENNGTCPTPQSHCVPAGPGLVDCLCSPGYHGYKCLRKGTFPTAAIAGGIGASTVVIAVALWVSQRRHVISKKNA